MEAAKPSLSRPQSSFPEPLERLRAFEGVWEGTATIAQTGQPVLQAIGGQRCRMVSGGWALQCDGRFVGEGFVLNEAFLGSYDAVSDRVFWAVTYSTGPVSFTVTGRWVGKTLELGRTLDVGGGQLLEEKGAWTFVTPTHRTLEIVTRVGGQIVATTTASVKKVGEFPPD